MTIETIIGLVRKGELKKAIDEFSSICQGHELETMFYQIESRFNHYRKDKISGILKTEDYTVERNNITQSFFELIKVYKESNTVINRNAQLADKLKKHNEEKEKLVKTVLSDMDEDKSLNLLIEFFSSKPELIESLLATEELQSKLNKKSSATAFSKKEIEKITKSIEKSTEIISKELRYYQKEAVSKAIGFSINAIKNKSQKIGYVYQTSGSGITITLLAYINEVLNYGFFKNHKILLLVDRLDLLHQLSTSLSENKVEFSTVKSSNDLMYNLDKRSGERIILSTIQKLHLIVDTPIHFTNEFLVLGYMLSGNNMDFSDLFPNAQFLNFTSTPPSKKSKKNNTEYIATYDLKSAIKDGVSLPTSLVSRSAYRHVINEEFLMGDSTLKDNNIRTPFSSKNFLETIAKDIFEHFNSSRGSFNGKALVLAANVETAIFLSELINNLSFKANEKAIAIAIVAMNVDNRELIDKFSQWDSNLRIAVVVNMLLTGYNNPLLDTLYVAKPIAPFLLTQAMTRINKVVPNKEKALVVDYFDNLNNMKSIEEDL